MRVVWAECSAIYHGRGDTVLPRHDRMILVKDDGSVAVHGGQGIKPLNYMGSGAKFAEHQKGDDTIWTFDTTKESLVINLHQIHDQMTTPILEPDPGLIRDGTEAQLQEWLSERLSTILPLSCVQREYQTGAGPVDLLGEAVGSRPVIIEVKRVATRAAVHQVRRYLDACEPETRALLIALDVRPGAREFAAKKGIPWVQLDWSDRTAPVVSDSSWQESGDCPF